MYFNYCDIRDSNYIINYNYIISLINLQSTQN